jgi:molybdopterin-guanine dinucleotide biosynthesis protein A
MGVDKARVAWEGWPLAVHVAGRIRSLCDEVRLVRKAADAWAWPDGTVIRTIEDGCSEPHPLAGVAAALRAASEVALIVPCDLPQIDAQDCARLLAAAPAIGCVDGVLQPLVAALTGRELGAIEEALARRVSARAALEHLPTVALGHTAASDLDRWTGPGPIERLLARLPAGVDRDIVGRGEATRLAARGALDPAWEARGQVPQS